jgi:uncharacterized sulfatase
MTGRSLVPLLTSEGKGRIETQREFIVTGIERHTYCRPEGATYPIRALRTHDYLYIRNFKPERWPTGGPEFISSNKAPHGDIDDGPFKEFMLLESTRRDFSLAFQVGFGKRPAEELYDVRSDPHQMQNRADDPSLHDVRQDLASRLETYLRETDDPRISGHDPWQGYIYRQVEGFGATFNMSLPEEERIAARKRGKHAVSPGAKE